MQVDAMEHVIHSNRPAGMVPYAVVRPNEEQGQTTPGDRRWWRCPWRRRGVRLTGDWCMSSTGIVRARRVVFEGLDDVANRGQGNGNDGVHRIRHERAARNVGYQLLHAAGIANSGDERCDISEGSGRPHLIDAMREWSEIA